MFTIKYTFEYSMECTLQKLTKEIRNLECFVSIKKSIEASWNVHLEGISHLYSVNHLEIVSVFKQIYIIATSRAGSHISQPVYLFSVNNTDSQIFNFLRNNLIQSVERDKCRMFACMQGE